MSIRKILSNTIEKIRQQAALLAVLDNAEASLQEKATAIRELVFGDSQFWLEIAKRTVAEKKATPIVTTATPTAPPSIVVKPVKVVASAPVSDQPVPVQPSAKPFNLQATLTTWLGQVGSVAGGNFRQPWPAIQASATRLFKLGVNLTHENWVKIFAAMRLAAREGKYILCSDAIQTDTMMSAPADLLSDHVFGHEGAFSRLMSAVSKADRVEGWHIATAHAVVNMIDVLQQKGQVGPQEVGLVRKLANLLEDRKVMDARLFDKIRAIVEGVDVSATNGNGAPKNRAERRAIQFGKKNGIPEQKYSSEIPMASAESAEKPEEGKLDTSDPFVQAMLKVAGETSATETPTQELSDEELERLTAPATPAAESAVA